MQSMKLDYVNKEEVEAYLASDEGFKNLLEEAEYYIPQLFGNVGLRLELRTVRRKPRLILAILIKDVEVKEAIEKLDELDVLWWLDTYACRSDKALLAAIRCAV